MRRFVVLAMIVGLVSPLIGTTGAEPRGGSQGFIAAWGDNSLGTLGAGTCCDPEGTPIRGPGRSTALAGGAATTVSVHSDGTVWEWGRTGALSGCTDLGPGVTTCPARRVAGLSDVVAVADAPADVGVGDRFALKRDGTVWTWGGSTPPGTTGPVQVNELSGIVQIAASGDAPIPQFPLGILLALKGDGRVWELDWGYSSRPTAAWQVPGLQHIAAIAAGPNHGLALAADGRVWSWRYPTISSGPRRPPHPALVPGPGGAGHLSAIVAIAAGDAFSLAADSHGAVWAWGTNKYGQLGIGRAGHPPSTSVPARVPGLGGIVAVAAGMVHGLALGADGRIWGWGGNAAGQVGSGSVSPYQQGGCACIDRPVQVRGIRDAVSVTAGAATSFALTRTPVRPAPIPAPPPCPRQQSKAPVRRRLPMAIPLLGMPRSVTVGERTGHVFLLSGCVTTVDLGSGNLLATAPAGADPISGFVAEKLGRVVVLNGRDPDRLHSSVTIVDATTGRLLRTTRFDSPGRGGAVAGTAGRVFALTSKAWPDSRPDEGVVRMLDASSGATAGAIPIEGEGAAVDERLGRAYITQAQWDRGGAAITALDARTGRVLSTHSFSGDVQQRRICGGGRVFVDERLDRVYTNPADTGDVCILDARTLALKRLIDCGAICTIDAVDQQAGVLVWTVSPNVKGATTSLEILDARDGRLIRRLELGQYLATVPVAVDEQTGNVYFVTPNALNVLNPAGWRVVRRVRLSLGYQPAIAVAQRARRVIVVGQPDPYRSSAVMTVLCADARCAG